MFCCTFLSSLSLSFLLTVTTICKNGITDPFLFLQGLGRIGSSKGDHIPLHLGLILPHSFYYERHYIKAVRSSVQDLTKLQKKGHITFTDTYSLSQPQILQIMMTVNPSPTREFAISSFCIYTMRMCAIVLLCPNGKKSLYKQQSNYGRLLKCSVIS